MNDVEGYDGQSRGIQLVVRSQTQVRREELDKVRATLGDVVSEELDAVDGHQGKQRLVSALEVALAVASVYGREFAPQDRDEEVAGTAGGLKEA